MADLVDIALSAEASGIADSILEKGFFKNKSDVMTFAAAYMIKHYFDEFDPSTYNQSDNDGSNYSYSTFDSDGKWSTLIKALYPNTDTPNLLLRALMNQGLISLSQRMEEEPEFSLLSEIN